MKKLKKLLLILFIALVIPSSTKAASVQPESVKAYIGSQHNRTMDWWGNLIEVEVIQKEREKVRVSIQNFGFDRVDYVKFTVLIYSSSGLQYIENFKEYDIPQFIPQNFDISITNWTKVIVKDIVAEDEGEVVHLNSIELYRQR